MNDEEEDEDEEWEDEDEDLGEFFVASSIEEMKDISSSFIGRGEC